MSPSDQIRFGLKAFSYVAVKHVPLVEPILKRISGGRINRHSLARAAFRAAVELNSQYAVDEKWLGERSATAVPLLVRAFATNDPQRMSSAIREMTREVLGLYVRRDPSGLCGMVTGPLHDVAAGLADNLSAAFLGPNVLEKTLARMVLRHGLDPVERYVRTYFGDFFGREFAIRQTLHCIQDLADDPSLAKTGSAEYDALADMLCHHLCGRPNSACLDVLRGYAPEAFAAMRALGEMGRDLARLGQAALGLGKSVIADPGAVLDSGKHLIGTVLPAAIDDVQRACVGIAPSPLELAYGGVSGAALAGLSATATEREVADTLLHGLAVVARRDDICVDANPNVIAQAHIETQIAQLARTDGKHACAHVRRVADALSPAQLMPLGPRGETRVGKTWTGQVAEVHGKNHHWLTPDSAANAQAARAIATVSTGASRRADDGVEQAFLARAGKLNIVFDGIEPRWAGLDALARLREACGGDRALMWAAMPYLDAALARQVLAKPMEDVLCDKASGLIDAGRVRVKVEDVAAPHYAFHVHRANGFVKIGIEARWKIAAYGSDAGALRAPLGTTSSSLVAGAGVTLRPAPGGIVVTCEDLALRATIDNLITFDPRTGAMRDADAPEKGRDRPQGKPARAPARVAPSPASVGPSPASVAPPPAAARRTQWGGIAIRNDQLEID